MRLELREQHTCNAQKKPKNSDIPESSIWNVQRDPRAKLLWWIWHTPKTLAGDFRFQPLVVLLPRPQFGRTLSVWDTPLPPFFLFPLFPTALPPTKKIRSHLFATIKIDWNKKGTASSPSDLRQAFPQLLFAYALRPVALPVLFFLLVHSARPKAREDDSSSSSKVLMEVAAITQNTSRIQRLSNTITGCTEFVTACSATSQKAGFITYKLRPQQTRKNYKQLPKKTDYRWQLARIEHHMFSLNLPLLKRRRKRQISKIMVLTKKRTAIFSCENLVDLF